MNASLRSIVAAAHSATDGLTDRSGSIFYSGTSAFANPCPVYILGLNPGGSPERQARETIGCDLREWGDRPARWSRYMDESWRGQPPGTHGMQPRMRHMFHGLGLDLREVPASNVVFVRTNSEADLRSEADALLASCWQFHKTVIQQLGIRTLLCLGHTAGAWARLKLGADMPLGTFRETYERRHWKSEAHMSSEGLAVVTLTHPGRADWCHAAADPTPLVKSVIDRP